MSIVNNKKAFHDFFIEDRLEAGMVLEGWEVKSIREGRVQLKDSYVKIKNGEIWLLGCHISPMISTSTHYIADCDRSKKLLLNHREIIRLDAKVEQKGYTLLALNLHYKKGLVKVEIALAKGKQLHDKRQSEKEREWQKEKLQILKQYKRL